MPEAAVDRAAPGASLGGNGSAAERVLWMSGSQGPMIGILAEPTGWCHAAVLIVAGQPQTRVGSHRMFVDLARGLAERGVASLRFDVGGWGDSPGAPRPFECSAADIAAAAAAMVVSMRATAPVWIAGLCDGASAAVLALPALRAAGVEPAAVVLLNPWVRSEASLGEAMVRTYYARRLFEWSFWKRLLSGKVPLRHAVSEPLGHLWARLGRGRASGGGHARDDRASPAAPEGAGQVVDLPAALLAELTTYAGAVLTVLSGNDLTAEETESLLRTDKRWRRQLERAGAVLRVEGADHTFSDPAHWTRVIEWIGGKAASR